MDVFVRKTDTNLLGEPTQGILVDGFIRGTVRTDGEQGLLNLLKKLNREYRSIDFP